MLKSKLTKIKQKDYYKIASMKKIALSIGLSIVCFGMVQAQSISKDSTLQITGSADVYYNYDFAQLKNPSVSSADQLTGLKPNSIDFGLLDLKVKFA